MQNLKHQFLLRDDITFLNFGSFGACPKPVFEKYQQLQLELEQEPVHFITEKGLHLLEDSRKVLSEYVHCHHNDLVYVTNPSYGVNTVAKSLDLKPGDEILTTNLEYGACDKTWDFYCEKTGSHYVRQSVSLPIENTTQFVENFIKGITSKTKLIFISHITSTTALRFPVEEICAVANEKSIPVFVDGAHAPGQVPIDLSKMQVDFYTGACHKWMMTPKGSSFLYVHKKWQPKIKPLIVSWGYKALFPSDSEFIDWHQMNGSRDYTAFLTIPAAINFMQKNNWDKVAADCRQLVYDNAQPFCQLLKTEPLAPLQENYIVQMLSARINTNEPEQLYQLLFEKYKIQIPVMRHEDKVYLRYSINAFNDQKDMEILFSAIEDIQKTTTLLA